MRLPDPLWPALPAAVSAGDQGTAADALDQALAHARQLNYHDESAWTGTAAKE